MNPEMENEAQGQIYGEIGDFADDMMMQQAVPDYFQNRAKPENMPGSDPAELGVTFSDDEMGALESQYGGGDVQTGALSPTNY